MTKSCPIMSYRKNNWNDIYCSENECAFWDEEMNMCCIKSAAIAVAGKKNEGSGSTGQAYYFPPSSYCYTEAVSDVHLKPPAIDNSYIQF